MTAPVLKSSPTMEKVIRAAVEYHGSRHKAGLALGIARSVIDRVADGGPFVYQRQTPKPLTVEEVERISLMRIDRQSWTAIEAKIHRPQKFLKHCWSHYLSTWLEPSWHKGKLSQPVIDFHLLRSEAAERAHENKVKTIAGSDRLYVRKLLEAGGFAIVREPKAVNDDRKSADNARKLVQAAGR